MQQKNLAITEIGLLISITFIGAILTSIFTFLSPIDIYSSAYKNSFLFASIQIANKLLPILLLFFLLIKDGKKLNWLGFNFTLIDIFITLLLTFTVYIVSSILSYLFQYISLPIRSSFDFTNIFGNRNFLFFIVILINPFTEELIVRSYLIKKIEEISNNNTILAGILSIAIQTLYHLYQGIIPALIVCSVFTIFTLFFIRFRKILPIIFAHMILDIISFFFYR